MDGWKIKVHEFVNLRRIVAAYYPRSYRKHAAVLAVLPSLGEPKSEDKDIKFRQQAPEGFKVRGSQGENRVSGRMADRIDRRPS